MRSHIAQPRYPTNKNLRRRCQENSKGSTNGLDSPMGGSFQIKKKIGINLEV